MPQPDPLHRTGFQQQTRVRQRAAGRLLVVNGHPDPRPERYCAALCAAYAEGARFGKWDVRELAVGALTVPAGHTCEDVHGEPSTDETGALEMVQWADRLAIVFPLWLGRPPAALTRFFDCAKRWSVGLRASDPHIRAVGRPARIVVTMEMPAFAYRLAVRANLADAEGSITLAGVHNPEFTFIGSVDTMPAGKRAEWLDSACGFGRGGV